MTLWVATGDVPDLDGDPTALSDGEGYLDDAGEDVKEASEAATTAWKKIDDDIYRTPEAPGIRQAVPAITEPMLVIENNLAAIAAAVSTASASLAELKRDRTALLHDVKQFRRRLREAENRVLQPLELPDLFQPNLESENEALWARVRTLTNEIVQVEQDLVADLADISAPDPALPRLGWTAGVESGSHARAAGPGASHHSWSGSAHVEGNTYLGSGFEAEAHAFQAAGTERWQNGSGQASGSLDVDARYASQGNVAVGRDGVHAQAEVAARAGVTTQGALSQQIDLGPDGPSVTVGAKGKASVAATAELGGNLDLGADGGQVAVSGGAYVGGKAEVSGTFSVPGLSVTVGVEGRAGVGAEGKAKLAVTPEDVELTLELGAAAGLGGGAKVDVTAQPEELVEGVMKVLGLDYTYTLTGPENGGLARVLGEP